MINQIFKKQTEFFHSDQTKSYDFRMTQLNKLYQIIRKNERDILKALNDDLGKPEFEGYATEVGFTLDSIKYFINNLKKWMRDEKVKTPIHQHISRSFIRHEPLGTVLIIGPYNYPFQLIIEPLAGAICAGNTCLLKPSEHASHTEKVIEKIINETFDENYIHVVTGGVETTTELLNLNVNYIFFTGSERVGRIVLEAAAKKLIPVTLELGGKSPAIIDETANLQVAARRIVWGKFINTGQTCIAPDYLYVHKNVKEKFLQLISQTITQFYGANIQENTDYGRIINQRHFDRIVSMIDEDKVYKGGKTDRATRYIEPTVMIDVTWEDKVMKEEIFGPLLPVLDYENIDEVIWLLKNKPKPLALYIFSEKRATQKKVLDQLSYGGGCINDTISHVASPYIPFGGAGNSGVGFYHGKYSFEIFSNKKSILKKTTGIDPDFAYPPYKNKLKLIKKIMK
ncbi:MAG: aldehyde dehydrogenase [Clostridia bacterium]|nr:aldehyde dehydrogenase [Clostridia bacterium]